MESVWSRWVLGRMDSPLSPALVLGRWVIDYKGLDLGRNRLAGVRFLIAELLKGQARPVMDSVLDLGLAGGDRRRRGTP